MRKYGCCDATMAHHLRRLSDIAAWSEFEPSPLWAEGDCPWQILPQVFDNRGGVSTWLVRSPDEIERAVAAQALMFTTIPKQFGYCLIDEALLEKEGIKAVNKPTFAVDQEIGKCHHELIELGGKRLIRLAAIIRADCKILAFSRDEVFSLARKYFDIGRFSRDALFSKGKRDETQIANSKNLLVDLWKRGELTLTLAPNVERQLTPPQTGSTTS